MSDRTDVQQPEQTIRGISVSPGIATGRIWLLEKKEMDISSYLIPPGARQKEIERFWKAVGKSREQLQEIRQRLAEELGQDHAYIIDTHLQILEDRMLVEGVIQRIENNLINAEMALKDVQVAFAAAFRRIEDEYLRERHSDVDDVINRVMGNLAGHWAQLPDLPPDSIIVASDLAPSETAQLDKEKVVALATERGGRTSHTSIMARSLGIPAVVGLKDILSASTHGAPAILDGNAGFIVINPLEETARHYRLLQTKYRYYEKELQKLKGEPAVTLDGHRVSLLANIELPREVVTVLQHGGEGVGLYRTEFLYMNRGDLPGEEEHLEVYRKLVKFLKGKPATIRTLDVGGDKVMTGRFHPQENPALGLRAIRFCLREVDIFKTQLRAILRASHHGPLKILFPMISGVEELRQARRILEDCKEELRREKIPFDPKVPVGTMIEVPSAAAVADLLARECDFFSIGTNDLIQYSLAIDRMDQNVSHLYHPLHPAILRTLQGIFRAARSRRIPVAMCGEMAGEAVYTLILLGMGLREFSMNPLSLTRVKKIILSVSVAEAEEMFQNALHFATADEVDAYVVDQMVVRFPNDISSDGRQICLL
jgi:phosphotransferase system enzyme I (PtsI)